MIIMENRSVRPYSILGIFSLYMCLLLQMGKDTGDVARNGKRYQMPLLLAKVERDRERIPERIEGGNVGHE